MNGHCALVVCLAVTGAPPNEVITAGEARNGLEAVGRAKTASFVCSACWMSKVCEGMGCIGVLSS